jgi:hypothetical protein
LQPIKGSTPSTLSIGRATHRIGEFRRFRIMRTECEHHA